MASDNGPAEDLDANHQRTDIRRPYQATGNRDGRGMQGSMTLGMRNFAGEFSTMMRRRDKDYAAVLKQA